MFRNVLKLTSSGKEISNNLELFLPTFHVELIVLLFSCLDFYFSKSWKQR